MNLIKLPENIDYSIYTSTRAAIKHLVKWCHYTNTNL